ncbi:hypothetical protein EYF80_063907 [Liparis tanakae]|uniref:Uncharacterized protein n=1 Tax=Liparis tanakae TaxID=230148 RepID=A0A4Z2EAQ2_9TELE|nr:hypothetical protein EYF80_063907 [Liparis tanakae]
MLVQPLSSVTAPVSPEKKQSVQLRSNGGDKPNGGQTMAMSADAVWPAGPPQTPALLPTAAGGQDTRQLLRSLCPPSRKVLSAKGKTTDEDNNTSEWLPFKEHDKRFIANKPVESLTEWNSNS